MLLFAVSSAWSSLSIDMCIASPFFKIHFIFILCANVTILEKPSWNINVTSDLLLSFSFPLTCVLLVAMAALKLYQNIFPKTKDIYYLSSFLWVRNLRVVQLGISGLGSFMKLQSDSGL